MDYFTADLHLGHANILKYCRRLDLMTDADRATFLEVESSTSPERLRRWKPSRASVEKMDRALLDNINAAVGKHDRLWILGDFTKPAKGAEVTWGIGDGRAFVGESGRRAACRAYRAAIACEDVRLVWGNHDPRHHLDDLFTHTYEAVRVYVHDGETHTEPELWASEDGRAKRDLKAWARHARILFLSHYAHVVWHHSDRGVYHLYGHSHGNLEPWREEHLPNALAFDVGVDCWNFKPLSFDDIDRLLTRKRSSVEPHTVDHHRGTRWRPGWDDDSMP